MTTTNYYNWANENLSDSRARAFKEMLRKIDDSKFSDEWRNASRKCDQIADDYYIAHKDEITAIETEARNKVQTLQQQIQELQEQVWAINKECQNAVMRIRCAVYSTQEYKEQEALASDLWNRDDAIVQPLREALVAKYATAQAKANAR